MLRGGQLQGVHKLLEVQALQGQRVVRRLQATIARSDGERIERRVVGQKASE